MDSLRRIRKSALFCVMALFMLFLPARQAGAAQVNVVRMAQSAGTPSGELKETKKGLRYQYENGTYAKKKWLYAGGSLYYFSSQGYAKTGWITYRKQKYYADASGRVYIGKWLTKGSKKYYLKKNGALARDEWIRRGTHYYYLGEKAALARSCEVCTGGKYYYVNEKGIRLTNCWVTRNGKRYYYGKNGVRYQNKWVKYKGKYYYLKKNGVMARDAWVGNYHVGSDGARQTNCYVDGYYLNGTGLRIRAERFSGKYLIVGDSRIVGMDAVVSSSKVKFIGKIAMGYSWLKTTAGPQVRQYLAGNQKLKVIFAFGINDLGNISQYISYYRSLQKEFPETQFCFLSVNPVNEAQASAYGYNLKNASIQSFNKKLKAAFGTDYLNTYSYLTKQGFSAFDGVHYTGDTYQKLYNYIVKKLG